MCCKPLTWRAVRSLHPGGRRHGFCPRPRGCSRGPSLPFLLAKVQSHRCFMPYGDPAFRIEYARSPLYVLHSLFTAGRPRRPVPPHTARLPVSGGRSVVHAAGPNRRNLHRNRWRWQRRRNTPRRPRQPAALQRHPRTPQHRAVRRPVVPVRRGAWHGRVRQPRTAAAKPAKAAGV